MASIVEHAPGLNTQDAIRIVRDLFDLKVAASQLPSERDQNFHLTAADGRAYVLKVANSTESREILDFQNQAMMHIAGRRNLFDSSTPVVPEVVPTRKGDLIASVAGADGTRHFVRLLTYLPGKPLALVRPHDAGLLASLGRFCGDLDRALQDFDHPATHRDFHWDLNNAGRVIKENIGYIELPHHRRLVENLLRRFQSESQAQLLQLRSGVIHNDANDYNVLVVPEGRWHNRVTGIIDFGDMVYTRTVCEVAIACAYAMLDKADPLPQRDMSCRDTANALR